MLLISFSFIVLLISLLALGIQILLYREWLKLTKLNQFKSKVNSKNSNNFFTKAGTVKPPKPNLAVGNPAERGWQNMYYICMDSPLMRPALFCKVTCSQGQHTAALPPHVTLQC